MRNLIEIQFDGGCSNNPGNKYGSFAVFHTIESGTRRMLVKNLRQSFGYGTNNEAEFEALIEGLKWVGTMLRVGGFEPEHFTMKLYTDSTVVGFRINGLSTANKTEPQQRMHALAQRCLIALKRYSSYEVECINRERNVALFGH